MAWRLMNWDLPDHLLVVGCAVCAVCAPIPWLGVIWKLFSQKFLKFLWFEVFPGIFFVLPIWKLLFPGVPEIFWFESCSRRTTGNGLETDELGLAGSLACRGLCCLCRLCSHSWLGVIWKLFSQKFLKFLWFEVFSGISLFFAFESYSFQEFLKFSGLKSCFSRTTGNGLETDELGLAGSLACRGLCCLCCLCSHSWLGVIWKLFSQKFLKFLRFEVFSGIFFVLPIWKLLFPGVPEIFWFESCFSSSTGDR